MVATATGSMMNMILRLAFEDKRLVMVYVFLSNIGASLFSLPASILMDIAHSKDLSGGSLFTVSAIRTIGISIFGVIFAPFGIYQPIATIIEMLAESIEEQTGMLQMLQYGPSPNEVVPMNYENILKYINKQFVS
jgi:hypothetical protein